MAAIHLNTTRRVVPQCYAYTTPDVPAHDGWTKIGFTERDVVTRVREQTQTADIRAKIWWHQLAVFRRAPFGAFRDTDFHAYLARLGVARREKTEWFQISPQQAEADFDAFTKNHGDLTQEAAPAAVPYRLREEQAAAVAQTQNYFETHEGGEFLWNAKPRFGKTLAAYDLCARLGAKNVLIVTNRPAIANSWYADYERFFGPASGYLFVSRVDGIADKKYVLTREQYSDRVLGEDAENENIKGCIEFVSLQDLKGSRYFSTQAGATEKLREVKETCWDVLIIDEAHEGVDTYKTDVAFHQIDRKWTLHLSGTPFKALASDKFPQDAIFNWTYADEQAKKAAWDARQEQENPYANLPRLALYTYQMSDIVRDHLARGIDLAEKDAAEYAFDLNEFFLTDERGHFVHDADVDKFLDALTRQGKFPFSTPELRGELKHTFWLLNRVASARALAKKLALHPVFKDYEIILAAGDGRLDDDAENEKAFDRVKKAIATHEKTITLSVGQLTTGVTIPEWTAVLMLANLQSPALYMQAAFRAQNPCLFAGENGAFYRKETAYVFDFDPARTLTIFEQFANDLIPTTAGARGTADERQAQVRELLNFFPVYGEDAAGEMTELDAAQVLTIPRHIHAREVVDRGFMSNFLFANISGIFGAPREVIDLINNMQAIEQPKKIAPVAVDEGTADALSLDEAGNVDLSEEWVIGQAADVFGPKIYENVGEKARDAVAGAQAAYESTPMPEKEELKQLQEMFRKTVTETMLETTRAHYGKELKKSTERQIEREIGQKTETVVQRAYGDYQIERRAIEEEQTAKIAAAQAAGATSEEISRIEQETEERQGKSHETMLQTIKEEVSSQENIQELGKTAVETAETAKREAAKDEIEGSVRDHLRGFSRTIPAFLMAYGDENTTLANFDTLVPADVFLEVTRNPVTGQGVTLENFRFLRDGGDYYERDENGEEIKDEAHKRHFDGHLFDELTFNDAVQEFLARRAALADYFEENAQGDIFDYIPPQRTNQIFTPKKVVREMVDALEKENPGCFDNPDATFADLYMKSGLYLAEIVTRLYRSKKMQQQFPGSAARLRHIFAEQVYGCAPTEIIYRIVLRYVLGFSDVAIKTHHIVRLDTLPCAKEGRLESELEEAFGGARTA